MNFIEISKVSIDFDEKEEESTTEICNNHHDDNHQIPKNIEELINYFVNDSIFLKEMKYICETMKNILKYFKT